MAQKQLNVEDVISQLSLDEKIKLLSGIDFWHTAAIPRLNVPSIRLTDGPNGIRGTKFFNGVPAACFPCGTALGATWDVNLIETAGRFMAEEARAKGAAVILGPTVNIQRSPLGGRGFESFSEDPYLSGTLASAEIRGIQENGVTATIKHFVCNDQEHERQAVNSVLSERALREIYLMPFQIAMKESDPKAFMTAYNKINSVHCSENKRLLEDILRTEWGFKGLVMSDWFGVYSTSESINAGVDLEMPGPSLFRGQLAKLSYGARKITKYTLDERVRNVLNLVNRVIATGVPENAPEKTRNTLETRQLLRKIGADSLVLLKNERQILPFGKDKSIAVIGPNAKMATIHGGGSAGLRPYYAITPFEGIQAQAKNVKYTLGATAFKQLPDIGKLLKTPDGEPGFNLSFSLDPQGVQSRRQLDTLHLDTSFVYLIDYYHPDVTEGLFYATLNGIFTPEEDGLYDFGLSTHGTAQLYIDSKLVIDNTKYQVPGQSFFGAGTVEEKGEIKLKSGTPYSIVVEFGSAVTSKMNVQGSTAMGFGGFLLGGIKRLDSEDEIQKAVTLAKEVDQVVICAGLNAEFESEGYDRPNMHLPAHVDRLIEAVATANPNTAVVMQSGTPVSMPWLEKVPSIIQAWYGGNETGNAIADILFGDVNPSGKLPLSFPIRNEDNPAFLSYRSELGNTIYTDDIMVGYRHYEKVDKRVNFAFGYGLSYTTFEYSNLVTSTSGSELDSKISIIVSVKNTGSRSGAEVVQLYIAPPAVTQVTRPVRELKGFQKLIIAAGDTKKAEVMVDLKYACSYWNEERDMWALEKGQYNVLAGGLVSKFEVTSDKWWKGL